MKKRVLLLLCLFLFSLPASARTLYWERIDVEMHVNPDSTVDISEKQEYVFTGAWNGGYRDIRKKGIEGIKDIEVWEGARQYERGSLDDKYSFAVSESANNVNIKWRSRLPSEPEYENTHKTFTINYKVLGLIDAVSKQQDELYWKAIFEEREDVVKHATVKLVFPDEIEGKNIAVNLYTGAQNSVWKFLDPRTLYFSGNDLSPAELFEVKVRFPAGLVKRTFSLNKYVKKYISPYVPFVLFGLSLILMGTLYMRLGRDYEVRGVPRIIDSLPPICRPPLPERSSMRKPG